MKRKIFLTATFILSAFATQALLTSCSSKTVLKVFNCGEYIQTDLLKKFEKEYDCKVKYSTFDSNESAIIQVNNNYFDIVVPSDYAIEELASKGKLRELDWEKIYAPYAEYENLSLEVSDAREAMTSEYTDFVNQITSDLKNDTRSFDFYKYAAPYFSGNVGIIYRKDKISTDLIREKGWEILRNGNYKIGYYNSSRDGFMVPLKELGYSMNSTNQNEIDDAYNWLVEQRRSVKSNLSYVTDDVLDGMVNGKYDIALVYSGDACYLMKESNYDLDFYVPSKGTNVWVDGMVIPTSAKQVDLAYKFIAFMTRSTSGSANALEVGYSPTTKKAFDLFIANDEYKEYKDYYTYEIQSTDEIYRYNESIKTYLDSKWLDVLNA